MMAFISEAKTKVVHNDGSVEYLDPVAYGSYRPQPGDQFNYSQFDGELINPTQIRRNIEALKKEKLLLKDEAYAMIIEYKKANNL